MQNSSKFLGHIPCEHCGSSDGNSLYDDGHQYCHVCHTHVSESSNSNHTPLLKKKMSTHSNDFKFYDDNASFSSISDRNINRNTCEFYGVKTAEGMHHYPFYDQDGNLASIKTRKTETKQFQISGNHQNSTLFGQNKFSKGGKFVTICEGEIDAMSAFQMMGSKYASVSIRNGASSAYKDCQKEFEFLDSFESIVICFDGDEPGKRAAAQVAELFGPKCKVFKNNNGFKDANEYLTNGATEKFNRDWWAAEQYTPDGIVQGATLWDEVNKPQVKADCMYPWDDINKLTYGMRKGELVTVTAGSGLGKSQFLRELVWHVLQNTKSNIGLMFLEESIQKTARSLMSLAIDKPIHLPDVEVSDEELKNAFANTLGTNRTYLFDHFGSLSLDNVVNRVRYMAKACNCDYVFLDHISIIVSSGEAGDERKALDAIMTRLRTLVQETGISLICVSHLKRPDSKGHEEGAATSLAQLRGSGSIAQLSDMVIGLERNGQAEDEQERNTTSIRVLKNRYCGMTGPAGNLLYDKFTGRMNEVKDAL